MKPKYSVINLGVLPGGSMSKAVALNDQGQIAGWGGYPGRPFDWKSWLWQEGKLSPIVLPRHDLTSVPQDMNDFGQIIGKTHLLVGDHSEIDRTDGGLKALSVGPGGLRLGNKGRADYLPFCWKEGQAEFFLHSDEGRVLLRAINNNGHVLGWLDTFHQEEPDRPARKIRKSFLSRDGNFTDIKAADGGKFQAYDLNDVGQVVGTADSLDGDYASHAWLWQDGRLTDLGTLGWYSTPHAINAAGQVVGVSALDEDDENSPVHGFLWERGSMVNLDDKSKGDESRPLAINLHGQIVGQLVVQDSPVFGFLWQDGAMFNLNHLIDPVLGWEITEAVDINDQGQIACNGKQDGISQGLLLNPL